MMMTFIGDFLVAVREIFRGANFDGMAPPNASYIAVAVSGYQIQSQLLHIPDRFGIFSPGPPGLQEVEGGLFTLTMIPFGFAAALGALTVWMAKKVGKSTPGKLFVVFLMTSVLPVVLVWVCCWCNPRRAEWKDGKLHKECFFLDSTDTKSSPYKPQANWSRRGLPVWGE